MLLHVRFRQEEALFPLLNHLLASIGYPYPGCIVNASGTLRPRAHKGLQFHCYLRLIVVENDVTIVVTPGLITCCNEPVETID